MSGPQVDPSAATPEDYNAGVVAGYPATGAAPAPVSSAPAAPDQPALQTPTDPGTSQGQSQAAPISAPLMSQDDIDKALKNLADKQQKARTEHAQTWMDKLGVKDGVLDPSRIEASQIQTGPDPDNKHGFFKDFGDRLWGATLESGKDALGAVAALENYAGASPEELGAMENIKAGIQKHIDATYADLSNAGKQALTASIWDGSAFQNPGRYLAGNIADMLPQGALAVGAGVAGAAAAPEEAFAATGALISRYAPEVLGKVLPGLLGPKLTASLATAATFGGLNAGQTYNALVDQVASATPKQLMDVPVYKASIEQGASDTVARQNVIHTTTAPFVALSGAVGALAGAGLGATATGALLPAGASLLKRAMVSAGETGVTMAAQGAGGDIAQQEGNIAVGTQQNFDPAHTAIAAASGFAGGVALGGPLGVFHGTHADGTPVKPPAAVPEPVETHVDPAQKAALDVSLTTPAPTPATTDQPDASQTPGGPPEPPPQPPSPPPAPGVGEAPPTAAPAPQAGSASPPEPAAQPGAEAPSPAPPAPAPPAPAPPEPAPPPKGVPVRSIQQIVQDDKVPPQQAVQVQRQEIEQNAKVAEERANPPPPQNPPSQTPEPAAQSPQEQPPPSAANAPPVPAEPVQGPAPKAPPAPGPILPEGSPPGAGDQQVTPAPAAPGASGPAAGPAASPPKVVTDPGVAAPKAPEPSAPKPEPKVVGSFETAKGSTYQVHEDGTTTRNKSLHQGHDPKDVGIKPRSARTIYVSPGNAPYLSGAGLILGPKGFRVALGRDGKAWGLTWNEKEGRWGASPGARNVQYSDEPALGLAPVELWKPTDDVYKHEAYANQHAGNMIVKLDKAKPPNHSDDIRPEYKPGQAAPEPAPTTPEPAPTTPEPAPYRQRIAEVQDRDHPRDAVFVPADAKGVGVGFKGVFVATKKGVGRFYSTDPEKIIAFKNLTPEEITPEKIKELEEPGKLKPTEPSAPEETPAPAAQEVIEPKAETPETPEIPETPPVPTGREEDKTTPAAPEAPPPTETPETPQQKLLRVREEQKAKRAAEKARIDNLTKGEQFEQDKNVHVEPPTEGEPEPEPVIQAKPEPIQAEDEEEPRDDISETYKEEVGEGEPEIIPGEGEGPIIAQQDIDLGDKTRADTSTDRLRDAKDLISKVDDGLMTIHEAANDFEWTPGKKGGRPARDEARTLKGYLNHVVKLTDPDEITRKMDDLIAHMSDSEKRLTKDVNEAKRKGDKREARVIEKEIVTNLLAKLGKLKNELDAHERNKGYLEALEKGDPVGDAVRDEIKPKGPSLDKVLRDTEKKQRLKAAAEEAKARKYEPKIEPYADRVNRHLALNTNFIDAMKDAQDHGQTYRLKDAMILAARNIAKDGARMGYIRNLLNHMANMVPDLEIMTSDHAYDLGKIDRSRKDEFDSGQIFGLHKTERNKDNSIKQRTVIMPSRTPEDLDPRLKAITGPVALAHEAIHAITFRAISDMTKIPALRPMFEALKAINNEFIRAAKEANYTKVLDDIARDQVEYSTGHFYHEVATQHLTNPEVHAFTSMLRPSEAFIQEMRRLGFDKSPTTLWEYFKDWLRRVVGIQKPDNAFEGSLLEAVMAPLQHVLERSAAYERGETYDHAASLLSGRETGDRGELASALRGALGPRVDGQVDRALRYIDLGGMTDRARKALLVATTWDGIVKKYRSMFQTEDHGDALRDLRNAKEKIDRVNAQYIKDNGDAVQDLIKRLQGREELAELMNDATIAKARLGNPDPKANKNVKNIQELTDRYNNLSADDRQTYQDLRDHYAKMYEDRATAERTALIDNFLPDATPAQKQAVDDLLKNRSPKEIQAFIDNADTSDIAKMFADTWDRSRNFVTGIADLVKGNKLAGDYFPLRRYGDYVLTYGDSANKATSDADPLTRYGMEMFEKKADAIARKAELEQAGHANVSDVMTKQESMDKSLKGNIPFVKQMLSSLENSSLSAAQIQEARDLLTSVVLEHGTTSDAGRIARRKGIGGASKEAARTLASEHLNFAYKVGRMLHGGDLQDALTRMRNTVVDMGRRGAGPNTQIVANAVLHEMEQRVKASSLTTSFTSELARKATNFGFMQSVASPSIMVKHTLEAQMNAAALLAPRHGAKATLALGKAMRDLGPRLVKEGAAAMFKAARKGLSASDWDMGRYGLEQLVKNGADRGQMERLFEKANAAGLIDHTMDKDIRDIAKGGSYEKDKLSTVWNRFRDFNTVGAHAADVMNRMVIAKATFDLELEKTGSEGVAIERAIDTLRDAIPNYGGKARIATEKGPLGKIALPLVQFKNYGLHMYSVMLGLAHQSLRGADATERKEAALALAGILGTHALMAGAFTILGDPLTLAGVAYGAATGQNKPHDFEADLRGFFSDIMGPTAGEIFSRGLPHAIGIDLSHNIGLSNLLEMPELEGYDGKSFLKWLGAIATGASGEDASKEVAGLLDLYHGNFQKGFEGLLPRPLRDPLKAIRYANEGIPGPGGRPGLPPGGVSPAGLVGQALGFQPADVSEYREGRAAVAQAKAEAQVEQQKLSQAWVTAPDNDARTEAMQAIQDYNASHPGEEIQMPTLFEALRRQRLNTAAQPNAKNFGLQLSPRQAKAMAQAGRFANVN
jgi:hypothetical protein